MTIPVLIYMLLTCITAVVVPWLGVAFYYVLAVGRPKDLWPQHFGEDGRNSLFISLAILIGLGLATATRQVDWRRLFVFPSICLMFLVVVFNLSIAYSPFAEFVDIKIAQLSSLEMLDIFNKIMIIFFVGLLLIDTRFKLITLITVIGGVLLVYVLWANKIYFTGEYWRFGDNGRLNGPWGSYHDENYLAMLFVLAVPIFYYLSVGTSYRVIRYGLWLCIPLAWHAMFLTGSRGGLMALTVTMTYIFFRSYSKKASIILMVGLVVAVVDQSGHLLTRVTDTVTLEERERDRAFIENSDDSPEMRTQVDPRLESWRVGLQLMADYPLLGVGAGNFMRAYPQYSDSEPYVAHNTFVQFGAACGVSAALVYMYFLFLRLKNIFQKKDPEKKNPHGYKRDYLDDLLNSLFIAFYSIAFFLDLMVLEITYCIILLGTCKYCLEKRKMPTFRSLIDSIYLWKNDNNEDAGAASITRDAPIHAMVEPVRTLDETGATLDGDEPTEAVAQNQYTPARLYPR